MATFFFTGLVLALSVEILGVLDDTNGQVYIFKAYSENANAGEQSLRATPRTIMEPISSSRVMALMGIWLGLGTLVIMARTPMGYNNLQNNFKNYMGMMRMWRRSSPVTKEINWFWAFFFSTMRYTNLIYVFLVLLYI